MKMSAYPSGDGVFYFANSTYAAFEWICYASFSDLARYDFTAEWSAATPTVWTFMYWLSEDQGSGATVGMQGGLNGPALQFLYDQPLVPAGTKVVCNFGTSSCSASSFNPSPPP
jgi:hypothetical protein